VKQDKVLGNWCLILAAMAFGMVIGGGHARTIGAGFSIQVWWPFTGWIPPHGAYGMAYYYALFQKTALYQSHPITLDQYKSLFWPMFIDRCWGRLMGLLFLIPFAWFFVTGRLRGKAALWMLGIFGLGVFQAVYGWYMVQQGMKPGVVSPPPAWAGPHLGSAMLILFLEIWLGLSFRNPTPARVPGAAHLRTMLTASIALIWLTMILGALVATSNAITVYNTFPTMDGHWLPPGMFSQQPVWQNFVVNKGTVQFCHRVLATITALTVLTTAVTGLRMRLPAALRDNFLLLAGLVALQYLLGMTTLVLGNVQLGYVHELNAVLLFATAIFARHKLRGAEPATEPYGLPAE